MDSTSVSNAAHGQKIGNEIRHQTYCSLIIPTHAYFFGREVAKESHIQLNTLRFQYLTCSRGLDKTSF